MWIVFIYIWLPYMILPIEAALERVPRSFIEASADLGARPRETFRNVILPLAIPGVAAGSIFTFSLTLGDYIIPNLIGNSRPFIGMVVYAYQGTAGNIPLAAAFTMVPILVMALYLAAAKRLRGLRCALAPAAAQRHGRRLGPEGRGDRRPAVPQPAARLHPALCASPPTTAASTSRRPASPSNGSPSPGAATTSGRRSGCRCGWR